MPVDRALDGQVILHEYLKIVSLVNFYQRARLLAVDEVHFSGKAVYKVLAMVLPQALKRSMHEQAIEYAFTGSFRATV